MAGEPRTTCTLRCECCGDRCSSSDESTARVAQLRHSPAAVKAKGSAFLLLFVYSYLCCSSVALFLTKGAAALSVTPLSFFLRGRESGVSKDGVWQFRSSFSRSGYRAKGLRWAGSIVFRLTAIYFYCPYTTLSANLEFAPAKQLVLQGKLGTLETQNKCRCSAGWLMRTSVTTQQRSWTSLESAHGRYPGLSCDSNATESNCG